MTTVTIPVPDVKRGFLRLWAVLGVVMSVFPASASMLRAKSRPTVAQLKDHFYTLAAFGLIDAAFFQKGWFWGLLVTGASCIVFEWKVSS